MHISEPRLVLRFQQVVLVCEKEAGLLPDPPGRDIVLGQQKAPQQQQDQKQEGATSGGNILIAHQRAIEAEETNAH